MSATCTLLLFKTVREVIKAEQQLVQQGVCTTVVPVPESISHQCGMCLKVEQTQLEYVMECLNAQHYIYTIHDCSL